ncbi:Insulin-like growth factor binding protein, N-terminal [Pseudocohnilembus persalinus]|uniref:Insulin-like growth factor binding protein, N-terminal n=1 Tax=Pseudocohnilembus persalinus TaxID=266149 RepID=A0A0V0QB75_PSEPJ|nr:Insulin-like growth factor binding protein, N-terminal [Pseudocohnilembus persalinus]|eukprot:KRW99500.1 Insulin-like growth factor binding protein, N-terminal [Pseudocohnilembus persalinus]
MVSCLPGYYSSNGYGKYLLKNICFTECPSSFFNNNNAGICEKCSENCILCNNQNICLICNDDTYLYQNQCVENCPKDTKKIVKSSENFEKINLCIEKNNCNYLSDNLGNCLDDFYCPYYSYKDEYNYCQYCQSQCIQCSSSYDSQCYQCDQSCYTCTQENIYQSCLQCQNDDDLHIKYFNYNFGQCIPKDKIQENSQCSTSACLRSDSIILNNINNMEKSKNYKSNKQKNFQQCMKEQKDYANEVQIFESKNNLIQKKNKKRKKNIQKLQSQDDIDTTQ